MPLETPRESHVWLKVPIKGTVEVTGAGEPQSWWQHWVGKGGKQRGHGVRCLAKDGAACGWCAAGSSSQVRYVLPVLLDGSPRVFEVGHVQFNILAYIEQTGGFVGQRVLVTRMTEALNGAIVIRPLRREHVSVECLFSVADLAARLGRVEAAEVVKSAAVSGVAPELAADRAKAREARVYQAHQPGSAPLPDELRASAEIAEGIAQARAEANGRRAAVSAKKETQSLP